MEKEIKENMLKYEKGLSESACKDKEAIRFKPNNDDIRTNYFRDIDRIIHSLSYTRYIDKTQVFTFNNNDHISKRIIHVQLVSKIARTIGRALNLNEDLIEAIALGHDIGHVPFGHEGEKILNELSLRHGEGYFMHNVQSVRTFMNIERNGKGSNLTIQVLDGILCHNGEFVKNEYYPKIKNKEEFLKDYEQCYQDSSHGDKLIPMTLEGCVVRISDIIGYIGRDIEDAVSIGIIEKEKIPKSLTSVLGTTNREIVNSIIMDIIKNSLNKNYIRMSDEVYEAVLNFKKFNYDNIYHKANTKEQLNHYKEMFEVVFEDSLKSIKENRKESSIYQCFLNNMTDDYLNNTSDERKTIDYIAGMTDDFLQTQYLGVIN